MKLYLVRHGPAVDIGEEGVQNDAARMLSAEGRAKTAKAARGLARLPDAAVARIVSSPLVRALETARIFARELGFKPEIESLPELSPGSCVEDQAAWLAAQPPADIMLVGHMPDLSDLASTLLCQGASTRFVFKKASVMRIDFDGRAMPGAGSLTWLLQPDALRRLAET